MSQKLINTRIGLKYDTYTHWTQPGTWSDGVFTPNVGAQTTYWEGFKPLAGEVIFFEIPSTPAGQNVPTNPPSVLFKVGDGTHFLNELDWGSALAADVYAWAKQQSILSGTYDSQTDTWSFPTTQDPVITNTRKEVKDFISANTVDIQVRIISTGRPNEFQLQTSTDGKPADDPTKVWVNSGNPFSFEQATYTAGAGLQLNGNEFSIDTDGTYLSATSADGLDIVPSTVEFTSASGYDITATTGVLTNDAISEIREYVNAVSGEYELVVNPNAIVTSGYLKTYELKQNGVVKGKIDIPKDFLVRSATSSIVTTADKEQGGKFYENDNYQVGDPYLDFVINVKEGSATDEYVYVNVKNLVDTYSAGRGLVLNGTKFSINKYEYDIADATSATGIDHFADAKQIKDFVDSETSAAISAANQYTDEAIAENIPTHTAGDGIDITTTSSDGIDVNIAVKLGGTQNNPSGLAFQGSGNGEGGLIIDDTLIWVLQCGDSTFPIE